MEQRRTIAQPCQPAPNKPPAKNIRWVGLYAVLCTLNLADIIVTHAVLSKGGKEGNPIMAPIVDSLLAAIAVKAAVMTIIGMLLYRTTSRSLVRALCAVDVFYLYVVLQNLYILWVQY